MLQPGKGAQKDDFLRLKAKVDTLLQIEGTKRVGNTFTLKLDKQFNVNIDEVLKSLGMKGGIEHEDAESMVDDAAENSIEEETKEQAPDAAQMPPQTPQQPPMPGAPPAMPDDEQAIAPMESVAKRGVYAFLFENDMFQPGSTHKKHRTFKRPGEYWKAIERQIGKNRNALNSEDILVLRKAFSVKPASTERDEVLISLDKAVDYFYKKILRDEGEDAALEFDESYKSLDTLRPSDYGGDEKIDRNPEDANLNPQAGTGGMSLTPDFDSIEYSDVSAEDE